MGICLQLKGRKVLLLLAGLVCCLVVLNGCRRQALQAEPPVTFPSVVVSQGGKAFYVQGLRIPGTMQELRFKEADTLTWLPLKQVSVLRFTGPACNAYRPAIIFMIGGERLRGDLFVDFLIEGKTDTGYWNMSMSKVESLEMGAD